MNKNTVRVRIAPSPTGNLHVGTARAALFNELFARHEGGTFIIRLEDTDPERSKKEFEQNILEGLTWLGLTWNEGPDVGGDFGPYRQSERREKHTAAVKKLLHEGKAKRGEGETIVLIVEPQEITFRDEIRGEVTVHTDSFGGDFIIARSETNPLFHLAVVVDDYEMQISHVIRGEDHLHNTAKHILLQQALGYPNPTYAHLPLLLDENRAKLSKRSGETNLLAYRDMGYLPQAMINYLALLGWSPKNDDEFFTHEELIAAFSLKSVQKAGAIFSLHKLDAINKTYINNLSLEDLVAATKSFMLSSSSLSSEQLEQALSTERPRSNTLVSLAKAIEFYEPTWEAGYDPKILVWKKSDKEKTSELLHKLHEKLAGLSDTDFTQDTLQTTLLKWIDENSLGRGDTLWPMRVALTGQEHSSGPFEVAPIIGKQETIRRIQLAQDMLHKAS